jgi:hypothetical protein
LQGLAESFAAAGAASKDATVTRLAKELQAELEFFRVKAEPS